MPPVKEPRYYAYKDEELNYNGPYDDYHINNSSVPNTREYKNLYDGVKPQKHEAVGDASPIYMYSEDAAQEIYNDVPNASLIAILRDPVERAYSDYLNMLRLGRDHCESFRKATEKEQQRIEDNWSPFYHYVSKGFYSKQLNRYRQYFDEDQFYITTHKRMIEHTESTMQDIFAFLGVDSSHTINEYKTYNSSGVPKNMTLHKFITHPLVPLPNFIKNINITYSKPEMDSKVRKDLYQKFKDEIAELEDTFNLDLSHWKHN
jgi:hypothetical protein